MAQSSSSQRRAIEKHVKGIAKEYERAAKRNPIRVPVKTEASTEGVRGLQDVSRKGHFFGSDDP
ncbi:hypothetical protein ABTY00_36840 [Streptomyces microflavus]|uniref:hypothetical protein n=1 Tax=Streptomyces microflavus TaxID=1919 RepID=UPI003329AF37